jgi:hypothetical protein
VIVDDLDVVSVAAFPKKTDTPLIVNSQAMLALSVAPELLQTISRDRRQVRQALGGMYQKQLPKSLLLECLKSFDPFAVKEPFRVRGSKRPDHRVRI